MLTLKIGDNRYTISSIQKTNCNSTNALYIMTELVENMKKINHYMIHFYI